MKVDKKSLCIKWVFLATIIVSTYVAHDRAGAQTQNSKRPGPILVEQLSQSPEITATAFSPNGNFILTGSSDETVFLWEVATGLVIRHFKHPGVVIAAAFSPDGRIILTGSDSGLATLWDAATGRELRRLGNQSNLHSVAFSPDGRVIVIGGQDHTILWDAATGAVIRDYSGLKQINSVAFSPDGRQLITSNGDKTARLWDVVTGKEVQRLIHSVPVYSAQLSPDGRFILTTGGDMTAHLWSVSTGTENKYFKARGEVASAAFSPDGRFILTGGDEALLWDLRTGNEVSKFSYPGKSTLVEFSPDGNLVLLGGELGARVYFAETAEVFQIFKGYSDIVWDVAFSRDGRYILTGGDNARLWDINTGQEVHRFGELAWVNAVAFSPDGRFALTGGKGVHLWNINTGQEVQHYGEPLYDVRAIAFSPDGRYLVTGGGEAANDLSDSFEASTGNTVRLWDTKSGKLIRTFVGHQERVISIAFSPDGHSILTGSEDKTARVWDVATGRELRRFSGHSTWVYSVAFSPDGRFFLTTGDDVRLWDAASAREIIRFKHPSSIFSAKFSPDGRFILTGSGDNIGHLWEIKGGREVRQFRGHSNFLMSVAFSPDGKLIVTGSKDNTAKIWNSSTGQEIGHLISFQNGTWAFVDNEGRFDTNSLEGVGGLHWIIPSEPFTTVPLEIFMRNYYEPRLLPRHLMGEAFKAISVLSDLNILQPLVSITNVEPQPSDPYLVTVSVDVTSTRGQSQRRMLESRVYDLRLYRDGLLVGYRDGPIQVDQSSGKASIKFTNIKLPRQGDVTQVEFSAYAFNEDRVKSSTAIKVFPAPRSSNSIKGRAYLISIGISAYKDRSFDLRYAAQDARSLQNTFSNLLEKSGEYEVVQVPLISESSAGNRSTEELATKENIKAVLDLLSGKPVDPIRLQRIPNASAILAARPEDFILISFAGHGYADEKNFYLLPSEVGRYVPAPNANTKLTEEILRRSISSSELAIWLRDVDAGDLNLIIDTSYSALAVGREFKPGPGTTLNLGQLAYDKGMRILTASDSGGSLAIESTQLRTSLLTYTLLKKGINEGNADLNMDGKITLGEFFGYAVRGVADLSRTLSNNSVIQRPVLYDFNKKGRDLILLAKN